CPLPRPCRLRPPRGRPVGTVSGPATRRTKIVCTIGPASSDPETVERLAWAGMDAARLNFSHGSADDHLQRLRAVRRAQEMIGRALAGLAAPQGTAIS